MCIIKYLTYYTITPDAIIEQKLDQQKMSTAIKKVTPQPTKAASLHAKTLKRSKSTEMLSSKKNLKKMADISEQMNTTHNLVKCKSTKSLKPKSKNTGKMSQHSSKKLKNKKSSDAKTIKKGYKENVQMPSILSEQLEFKKKQPQFFLYHNNYIPIQNSAQRRLVFKIQLIDLQNKSTASSFLAEPPQSIAIETEPVKTNEVCVGKTIEICNQTSQTQIERFSQAPQKCFVDLLTQLEFLYMPNQNNFKPFTANQRTHYSQMLEALARKMLAGADGVVTVRNSLTDEQIAVLLYQREGIQVGALQYIPVDGFPTHLLSILAYLKNLFCFIQYAYKQETIQSLRTFYGLNYNQRASRLTRGLPHLKDSKKVLVQQMFEQFQQQMFKDYQFPSQITQEAVHTHNRAIFDAVNQQLQAFRPFFTSQGEPFPWTSNLGMTHYDINEEALFIIFVQIKQKIQKQCMTLCGMHLDFQDSGSYHVNETPFYKKKMQEKQTKMLNQQPSQIYDKVQVDYQLAGFKFNIAEQLVQMLLIEAISEIQQLKTQEDEFQFIN